MNSFALQGIQTTLKLNDDGSIDVSLVNDATHKKACFTVEKCNYGIGQITGFTMVGNADINAMDLFTVHEAIYWLTHKNYEQYSQ